VDSSDAVPVPLATETHTLDLPQVQVRVRVQTLREGCSGGADGARPADKPLPLDARMQPARGRGEMSRDA
jgi:hypothetical protein